jgi:ABC-type proline/glycine betaine transport system permease subunit
VLAVGGIAYAQLFVSSAAGPQDVMSPQTFTSVLAVGVAWWVAAAALALSLWALSSRRSRASVLSIVVSGAYVVPSVAFLAYAVLFK